MSGELVALISAALWAVASVLTTVGARRLHVIPLNMVRCLVSSIFFLALLPFFGGLEALVAIPPVSWLWLVVSVVMLLVVGDTLYFLSLEMAGVSWAMPVAGINPLWAVLLATIFVNEPLSWSLLGGAVLVVAGIVLVSRPPAALWGRVRNRHVVKDTPDLTDPVLRSTASEAVGKPPPLQNSTAFGIPPASSALRRRGLLLALTTSVVWAVGHVALKPATAGIDPVVANSVRQPLGALVLLGLCLFQGRWRGLRGLDARSWGVIVLASLIGTGVGSLLFVLAIQLIGAGRTAVLTSTAPLLAIPFSMLWLQERPTRWTLAGTLLTATGIVLVA